MAGFLSFLGGPMGILSLIQALWPTVQSVVHTVEAVNPQAGAGAQKFEAAVNQVMTVAGSIPAVVAAVQKSGTAIGDAAHAGDIQALTTSVGDMVNIAVKLANAAGAFQKSGFIQAVTAAQAQGDTSGGA